MLYTDEQINTIQQIMKILNTHYNIETIKNPRKINNIGALTKTKINLLQELLDIERGNSHKIITQEYEEKEKSRQEESITELQAILDFLKSNNYQKGYELYSETEYGKANLYPYTVTILFDDDKLLYKWVDGDPFSSDKGKELQEYITTDNLRIPKYQNYITMIYDKTVKSNSRNLHSNSRTRESKQLSSSQQSGGKKNAYKITNTKVQILHNKKVLTRNVYLKKNTEYCKVNNKFKLLSKLKKM